MTSRQLGGLSAVHRVLVRNLDGSAQAGFAVGFRAKQGCIRLSPTEGCPVMTERRLDTVRTISFAGGPDPSEADRNPGLPTPRMRVVFGDGESLVGQYVTGVSGAGFWIRPTTSDDDVHVFVAEAAPDSVEILERTDPPTVFDLPSRVTVSSTARGPALADTITSEVNSVLDLVGDLEFEAPDTLDGPDPWEASGCWDDETVHTGVCAPGVPAGALASSAGITPPEALVTDSIDYADLATHA